MLEEIGGKMAKLNEDLKMTLLREGRRYETTLDQLNKQLSADVAKAETDFQNAKAAVQAWFDKRKVRISQAYQASREQALKRVDEKVGARKYELQKGMLQAEKDRDAGLAAHADATRQFQESLAAEEQKLAELERDAQRAFRGYGWLRRGFLAAYEHDNVDVSGDEHHLLARLREHLSTGKNELVEFKRSLLLKLFRPLPLWLFLAVCELAYVPLAAQLGLAQISYGQAGLAALATVGIVVLLRFVAQTKVRSLADSI